MKKFESGRNTSFSVILGFIPRIHAKHPSLDTRDRLSVTPEYDGDLMVDTRVKPEYDREQSLIKGLMLCVNAPHFWNDVYKRGTRVRKTQVVTRQTNECIETAESGVDKVVSSCEKNPNTLPENLDSVRECAETFKRRVQKEYTSAKISSRHQLNEFSLGRSMIEMLGVLAIIGVLSVGGIAGYSKAMEKFKINKTIQQIAEITTNIQTLYLQQDDFNGLSNTTAVQMGVVPDDLKTNADRYGGIEISHAFNGNVDISYVNDNPKSFSITFTGLPKEACMTLATTNWGSSSTGLVGVLVGEISAFMNDSYNFLVKNGTEGIVGHSAKGYYANAPYLPLSPAKVLDACGEPYSSYAPGFSIKFTK